MGCSQFNDYPGKICDMSLQSTIKSFYDTYNKHRKSPYLYNYKVAPSKDSELS